MIDKIAWILIKDKHILSSRTRGKDTFYIPGGKREGNETDIEALVREVKEELSVDIRPETARLYGIFEAQAHGHAEGIVVRMTCYEAEYDGELATASEIEEMQWFTAKDADRSSPVDKIILADLKSKGRIE